MQKIFPLLMLYLITYSSAHAYDNHYKQAIEQEIRQVDPNINIGIKIRNLSTGKVVYERNANSYYNFASALKFITLASLRQYFSNDYHFTSKIWQKGNDYYLDINDPSFSTVDLDNMLKTLKSKSHNTIQNFYIVNSTFSLPPVMESKMIEDAKYCYGALITKVHINQNCIRLQLRPNEQIKSKIYIDNKESIVYKIVHSTPQILQEG
ncbi:D-alanyl-D-alanine carboxypeptidase [Candidatus Tisiphia endosymbiont of Nemotelus uliginosus]|uniref:D-alanyl-D-alanine carboxypeptidase n=1 Tax=Candidatus Tisiphia endosymbiont of Nemotelus uliginosus TaxID=3077926 RepID=UPI0035C8F0B1